MGDRVDAAWRSRSTSTAAEIPAGGRAFPPVRPSLRSTACYAFAALLLALPVRAEPTAYLFNGGGDLLVVDLQEPAVGGLWKLRWIAGVHELLPEGPMDGLPVEGAAFDADRRVLYLVLPTEARMGEEGRKGFRVVALGLPTFERFGSWQVPQPQQVPPSIVLLAGGRRLLVQYASGEAERASTGDFVLQGTVLEAPGLRFLDTTSTRVPRDPRQRAAGEALPHLTPRAEALDGGWLLDGDRLVRWGEEGFAARRLDPLAALPAPHRDLLSRVAPLLPQTGLPRIRFRVVSQSGGRVLVRVQPEVVDESARFMLFTYAPLTEETSPPILVPPGRAWLSGDRIVVQGLEGGTTTGEVTLYDVATGSPLEEVESPDLVDLAAEGAAWLCGGGGRHLLRGRDRGVVIVTPESGEAERLPVRFVVDDWTRCFVVGG